MTMKTFLIASAVVLIAIVVGLAVPAHAQGVGGGVFQSGPVVAGHLTTWKSAGVIQDGGAPGGGGTVSSVTVTLPLEFSCTGNPITGSGVINCSWASETANTVFAAPNGAPGTPAFRSLVLADLPAIACANLSNGGTACPANTGTSGATVPLLNGANTWSGLQTLTAGFSQTGAVGHAISVTALPAQAAGKLGLAGTATAPTLAANSEGDIYLTAAGGLNLGGQGSTADVTITNKSNAAVVQILTGGVSPTLPGITTDSGHTTAGVCEDTTTHTLFFGSGPGGACATPGATVVTPALGGTGLASPAAHSLLVTEGASNMALIGPGTAGQIPVGQSAATDPAFETIGGDCTLAATGALTCTKLNGVAPGSIYPTSPGQGLQISGTSLLSDGGLGALIVPVTTTQTLTNALCGATVQSNLATGTLVVTLPAAPPPTCEFSFITQTNAIVLNPNGQGIRTGTVANTSGVTLPVPGGLVTNSVPTIIAFDGTLWRFLGYAPAQIDYTSLVHEADQQLVHGQVYLSLTGTTLQLCPSNGPGGLIIAHVMRAVPPCNGSTGFGALLPASATTGVSALNYIYAQAINAAISSADNTTCNGRITVANESGMQPNDTVIVFNLAISTEGNGTWTIASIPDATHICLAGLTFTHTGADTGTVIGVGLAAATASHVTDSSSVTNGFNDNVEVRTANGNQTLVGIVQTDGAQALNDSATKRDVLSWFNRQPKKMIVQVSGSAPTIASGSAGSFLTTTPVIEGEFVVAGPQSQPGSVPTNSVDWRVLSNISDGGITGVCALGATFNTTAQSSNAAVTGQPEVNAGQFAAGVASASPVTVAGLVGGLSEGRQFMDMAGWSTAVATTCNLNGVLVPITVEAIVWQ